MGYQISTGLIKEKFKTDCECPLCRIKAVAEEQFLHEFLNDAVMEETTRLKVNRLGFCKKHFDMLYKRQNKLSLALQISTRVDTLIQEIGGVKNVKMAKKQAENLKKASSTCIICDLLEESMEKYYKTVAQMFAKEKDFTETLKNTKGFCLEHYIKLLEYSDYAGFKAKEYAALLGDIEERALLSLQVELNEFCKKHDYRNAYKPLGTAETSLPRMRIKLYGEKET